MRSLGHQFLILNLAGLQNLVLNAPVLLFHQERTATRLAFILYHSAHANRPVQRSTHTFGGVRAQFKRQLLVQEILDILQVGHSQIQLAQVTECLGLLAHQNTCQQPFIANCRVFQTVRHNVVNVLNKHDICILLAQILDERSVTTRTEQQLAV